MDFAWWFSRNRSDKMAAVLFLQLLLAAIATVIAEIEMEFTKWPESVTAPVGDIVTFECEVRVPGERLAWRWKATADEAPWRDVHEPFDSDVVSTRLAVEVKDTTRNGLYQCVVWYGAVVLASVPARLTVARVELSRNSAERRVITAPIMNTVALHCRTPESNPPAVLTWFKEEMGNRKQVKSSHGVLVIYNATAEDSGAYSCSATNELSGQILDLPEKVYLKVQNEGRGSFRFLETQDYVGTVDEEEVLTVPIQPNGDLHLWCGVVGNPQPVASWGRDNGPLPGRAKYDAWQLTVTNFKTQDEGIYSCSAGPNRRWWKVISLQPAHWEGSVSNVNGTEGGGARVSCGTPVGQPPPKVYWLLNGQPVSGDKAIKTTDSELYISRVEKRHASIVQCFACNVLGCAYDAAWLSVVPKQISDQDYSVETGKTTHFSPRPQKRHNKKNSRKHTSKAILVPPSRPNVTRMSDESVMVSWSNASDGLAILFFKVQYKEATNLSNSQWNTCNLDIPPHVHSYQINGLTPDRYYKFRISAVYSNQDNKQGRSSSKFYLQRGGYHNPNRPVLVNATALSLTSILLNWTWSSGGGVQAEGFYVYYRDISSAGEYVKVTAEGGGAARSIVLSHLTPDTGYEVKVQSYTAQAPSDFSSILKAKTLKLANTVSSTETPKEIGGTGTASAGSNSLVTVGGAAGAALVALLAGALLLCRRSKRPHRDKEKVSVPEGGGANGYIPAKVPITITANPMHAEGGDSEVEMSYMHNNNTGGNDDSTLPHSRKNGPAPRQYV